MLDSNIAAQIAELLRAIGQETRLFILEKLKDGEKCVCDFYENENEQSNISKHLSILRLSGVVKCRRKGRLKYYSIQNPEIFEIIDIAKKICEEKK